MKMKMLIAKLAAVAALTTSIGGTWHAASAAPMPLAIGAPAPTDAEPHVAKKSSHKELTGKLNLNTATEDQLMLLPAIGPAKAERIVAWRKKNGSFKRIADLRHVKGFGYKSFKKLEPYLDIKGDTTLEAK